jgi:hypothetical protein
MDSEDSYIYEAQSEELSPDPKRRRRPNQQAPIRHAQPDPAAQNNEPAPIDGYDGDVEDFEPAAPDSPPAVPQPLANEAAQDASTSAPPHARTGRHPGKSACMCLH